MSKIVGHINGNMFNLVLGDEDSDYLYYSHQPGKPAEYLILNRKGVCIGWAENEEAARFIVTAINSSENRSEQKGTFMSLLQSRLMLYGVILFLLSYVVFCSIFPHQ